MQHCTWLRGPHRAHALAWDREDATVCLLTCARRTLSTCSGGGPLTKGGGARQVSQAWPAR